MIRKFKCSDIDAVMQIWKNENIKAHDFISQDYWLNNYDYVKSVLPNAEIYVYTENDEISGFLGLNGNYIEGIFVKSESQHNGIGSALLNKAKQNNTQLTLNVYEKNINVFNFYKKSGFTIAEEKTDTETNEKEFKMMWKKEQ